MIIYNSDLKIFYSTLINDSHYFSGFSSKELGSARETENIFKFFSANNISFENLVLLNQIHSTNIAIQPRLIPSDRIINLEDSDGVITKNAGVILVIRNADCVPLLFVDKSTGSIGISHQGWRGSLKNMAAKMLKTFLDQGSKVENLVCSIGPAIGSCCYDIDDDRYYDFLNQYYGYSDKIFIKKKGRWYLSLAQLNYLQLIEAKVQRDKIDYFPFCTKCDSKRFFSRRRSKTKKFEEMFNFIVKLK